MKSVQRAMIALAAVAWAGAHAAAAKSREPGSDTITFAASGDLIGPYTSIAGVAEPGLARVAALFQHADVGFANQEGSLFDLDSFAGYPAAENGGGLRTDGASSRQ